MPDKEELPVIALRYIGKGAFVLPEPKLVGKDLIEVPGIPARDLTADEVKEHGGITVLLATGLYERVEQQAKKEPAK